VLLADDHAVVRKGLRFVLSQQSDIRIVGEASDGREAVDLASKLRPDVVILDIAMPNLNGIEAAEQIIAGNPRTEIVILSMHSDESYLMRTLKAGAKGYLLKESADDEIVQGIRAVARGRPFFSPAIAATLLEDYVRHLKQRGAQDSFELLTSREREILQLIAEGKTNKEIASGLNLSIYTVETHRSNLMQKLDLHNTAEIVLYAVRKGIINWQ